MSTEPRYPNVEAQLTGNNGSASAIMGAVCLALRRAGVPQTDIDVYVAESMSGDYEDLLRIAMKWVAVA
jgi:hypothetical protein